MTGDWRTRRTDDSALLDLIIEWPSNPIFEPDSPRGLQGLFQQVPFPPLEDKPPQFPEIPLGPSGRAAQFVYQLQPWQQDMLSQRISEWAFWHDPLADVRRAVQEFLDGYDPRSLGSDLLPERPDRNLGRDGIASYLNLTSDRGGLSG